MKDDIKYIPVGSRVRVTKPIADNEQVVGVEATIGKVDRGDHGQYKSCYRINFNRYFSFGPFLLNYAWVKSCQIEMI